MAQKNNTRKNQGFIQKVKKTKWYILLPIIIIIGLILNAIYKKAMTVYDISLLDKAKTKLRALDLPKADKTIYKRSCSVRSVKFQDPGKPTCRIQRVEVYSVSDTSEVINIIKKSQSQININHNIDTTDMLAQKLESGIIFYEEMNNFSEMLECIQSYSTIKDFQLESLGASGIKKSDSYFVMSNTCSKKFQTLAYPES